LRAKNLKRKRTHPESLGRWLCHILKCKIYGQLLGTA
jgi:hypothetical protein